MNFFLYNTKARNFSKLRDGFVCGRAGNIAFPHDRLSSRHHCRFRINRNEIYIEDLSSINKTWVNSVPVQPGRKRRIRLNDLIEFGSQRFVLCHQDRIPPGTSIDPIKEKTVYMAAMKEDGSLTSSVPQTIPEKTLVKVDRVRFRKLKVKSAARKLKKKHNSLAIWFAAWVLLGFLIFIWSDPASIETRLPASTLISNQPNYSNQFNSDGHSRIFTDQVLEKTLTKN